jgi:hypothetical protein
VRGGGGAPPGARGPPPPPPPPSRSANSDRALVLGGLGYSRNPTQCVNVLVLRFVAGLLRPRLFFKQVEQSSK